MPEASPRAKQSSFIKNKLYLVETARFNLAIKLKAVGMVSLTALADLDNWIPYQSWIGQTAHRQTQFVYPSFS